ncbi:helix-turn-helix transcriptional regulator [Actinocorallia libanotica]|uniref:Helix-turn-helix transcriptional regulator n=1 Tax=Actinocorallia libanotica TaxID=46162 RepID=A0ABN1S2R9_9ACTN
MATSPPPDPKTSIWAWIASTLRFHRTRRGLSGDALGRILNCSKATISRLETGITELDERQAAILDRTWDTGGLFTTMLWYARLGHSPNWLQQYIDVEAVSSVIRAWESTLVPGLLQTPDYARAALQAGNVPDVEAALAARMARQEILEREDPPVLWILILESLLEIPGGGRAVMRAQIAHLLEASHRPNVGLRVIPKETGLHSGLDGPFMIMTTGSGDVAYVEAPGGGRLVPSQLEVQSYVLRYDRISQEALPAGLSRDLMKQIMEAM